MNPAAVKAARIQKDWVFKACVRVKFVSRTRSDEGISLEDSATSSLGDFDILYKGSGTKPMSSGLRAINIKEGMTPTQRVNIPRKLHAERHPHSPMIICAVTGMIASPAPLAIVSTASPRGLRLINQLLMAVGKPSSSGPENIMRPGIYKI